MMYLLMPLELRIAARPLVAPLVLKEEEAEMDRLVPQLIPSSRDRELILNQWLVVYCGITSSCPPQCHCLIPGGPSPSQADFG